MSEAVKENRKVDRLHMVRRSKPQVPSQGSPRLTVLGLCYCCADNAYTNPTKATA